MGLQAWGVAGRRGGGVVDDGSNRVSDGKTHHNVCSTGTSTLSEGNEVLSSLFPVML